MSNINRIVIKIGTSVIADDKRFDYELLEEIFSNIVKIKNKGIDVVIVTSGAVGLGALSVNINKKPNETHLKQALSTIGQPLLMMNYINISTKYNLNVSQILLTKDIIEEKDTRKRLKDVINYLFNEGVIPIINENDAIVFGESQIGDNDTVAALVTDIIDGDGFIIVSDVDGIYDKNPKECSNAKRIPIIDKIDETIINCASDKTSNFTSGGMATKINAAKIAYENKFNMFIIDGNKPCDLVKIIDGEDVGTKFVFRS